MSRRLLALLFLLGTSAVWAGNTDDASIGYPSYDAAMDALQSNPDAKLYMQDGWTVAEVNTSEERSIWSFTPANHPAHPAVIKRFVVSDGSNVYIEMRVLCTAEKQACDQLVKQFKGLNESAAGS